MVGRRTGMSLTMNFLIIAVIGIAVAAAVLGGFGGGWTTFENIVMGGIEGGDSDLAREHCLREKGRLCSLSSYSADSNAWADDSTYEGVSCTTWIVDRGVLPTNDDGEPYNCNRAY